MTEPWLSADDIAAHLGVTKDTVYRGISDKGMPAHKVGRLWRFKRARSTPGSAVGARLSLMNRARTPDPPKQLPRRTAPIP